MTENINKEEFKEEVASDPKIDKSKLESEGACEIITGKDEEKICEVKS